MKILTFLVLVAAGVAGCARTEREALGVPVLEQCGEYTPFPVGTFNSPNFSEADLVLRRAYSNFLASIREPSLYCGPSEDSEVYRFVWIGAWKDPVSIRVFRRGDQYFIEGVIADRNDRTAARQIFRQVSARLTAEQCESVLSSIEAAAFWETTTGVDDIAGNDGATWTLEARRDGRYHLLKRHSGAEGVESVRAVGAAFRDLAGFQAQDTPY